MKWSTYLRNQLTLDSKSIIRDPMLRYVVFAPLIMAFLMKFLFSIFTGLFTEYIPLADLKVLLMSFFMVLMTPILYGMIIGMLLLEEKDDKTLDALRVTPLGAGGYVGYRLTIPIIFAITSSLILFPVVVGIEVSYWKLIPITVLGSFWAPIMALSFASLATNKVEGFALMKGMGLIFVLPIIAFFVPQPYQLLFAIIPTFWPVKAYWVAVSGGQFLIWTVVGMLLTFIILKFLFYKFTK